MIRRLIISVFGALLSLLALVVIALFVLLRTNFGHDLVLRYALPRVEAATGLSLSYSRAAGAWPNAVVLNDLALSDKQGTWFKAKSLVLYWHAALILSNRVDIAFLKIDHGELARMPALASVSGTPSKAPIPRLIIRKLDLARFHMEKGVAGTVLDFDLDGSVGLRRGQRLTGKINLDLDTPSDLSQHMKELLGAGVKISTAIDGNLRKTLALKSLRAQTRDGRLAMSGDASYAADTHALAAAFAATAQPSVATWMLSDLSTSAPIVLKGKLSGPFTHLAIAADATFKDAKLKSESFPGFAASADVVMTHQEIDGPIKLVFVPAAAGKPADTFAAGLAYRRAGDHLALSGIRIAYRGAAATGALDLDVSPLAGTISFDANIPNLAVLPIAAKLKGPLKAGGSVRLAPGVTGIDVHAASDDLGLPGIEAKKLAMDAKGTLANLAVMLGADTITSSGTQASNVAFSGTVARKGKAISLRADKLEARVAGEALHLLAPSNVALETGHLAVDKLDVAWGPTGRFTGSLKRDQGRLVLRLNIAGFEPPAASSSIAGTIDIDTARRTAGMLDLELTPTRMSPAQSARVNLVGRWDLKHLTLDGTVEGTGANTALKKTQFLKLVLPLSMTLGREIKLSLGGPVQGSLFYKGQIAPLLAVASLESQSLKGDADIDLQMGGTLAAPEFSGTAALHNGTYEETSAGIYLDKIEFGGRIVHSAGKYALVASLAASDGMAHAAGATPIKANLTLTLGAQAPRLDANFVFAEARIVHLQTATGIATGNIAVSGPLNALSAKGALSFKSLDIEIPDSVQQQGLVDVTVVPVDANGRPIEETKSAEQQRPGAVALAIGLDLPNISVKGRGLDSSWSGKLDVAGTTRAPTLSGTLTLTRGRFDFSGRQFTLTRGTVGFVPAHTSDPDLSMTATYTSPANVVATISVIGRASAPRITLSSDPPQSEEDIMALVLFGKQAKDLSAFEAVQTANALAQLTGAGLIPGLGGQGILARARSTLGLDLLSFSLGAEGAVSIGKYIRSGVYVAAKQGFSGQTGSVSLTIDLNKWLSITTDVGQDSSSSLAVLWKRDY